MRSAGKLFALGIVLALARATGMRSVVRPESRRRRGAEVHIGGGRPAVQREQNNGRGGSVALVSRVENCSPNRR